MGIYIILDMCFIFLFIDIDIDNEYQIATNIKY